MVVKREYSAATCQLLSEKGFKCVCELCDCGRYHRHDGCTRDSHKMQKVFKHPGMGQVETDYQATFKPHGEEAQPRHLRKPLPKLRNPHPPPMDFRTEQRMEFIEMEIPFTKPCKMMESYTLPSSKVVGKTEYNQQYVSCGTPTIPQLTRPKTVIIKPEAKFESLTTHNTAFTPKVPIPQATYGEIPNFTGSILFPDKTEKMKTWNQEVYRGTFAPVAELCKPHAGQVSIGTEGDHFHGTTHKDTYKDPEQEGRQEAQKRKTVLPMNKRAKFQSETQSKSDFPGYGGNMPKPTRSVRPPPATLKLAMNNAQNFQTTNDDCFKITWDPKTIGKTKILRPGEDTCMMPRVKMEGATQTMVDFNQKQSVKMPIIRPQTRTEPSKAKFHSDTAYNSHYKPYSNVEFKRYGDFHETGVYLKPVAKFYQDGSVTAQDYQGAIGGRPRTGFIPEPQLKMFGGKMIDQTIYKAAYSRKPQEDCSYLKWVSNHAAKKEVTKILSEEKEAAKMKMVMEMPVEKKKAIITGS